MKRDYSGRRALVLHPTIPEQFRGVAARHPDSLAVKTGDHTLTYAELDARSDRLACAIFDAADRGPTVGLLLDHGVSLSVGVLGCLKAGKAYVPLEPVSPPDRLARILGDAEAALVVTDGSAPVPGLGVGELRLGDLPAGPPARPPACRVTPEALACVLYTSGSTGRPKGVMYRQEMILARVVGHNRFGVGPGDRISALGAGGMNLFRALLTGAALVSLDVRAAGIEALPGWLRRERITLYHSVPTLFRHLVAVLGAEGSFPDLRVVNLTGEALLAQDVAAFRRHFGESCVLVHGLGTTEAGTFRELRIDRGTRIMGRVVPVGFAVEGTDVLLLARDGNLAAPGGIGEIAVRGEHLAAGYWKRPELTAARFLPDPDGGPRRIYRTGDLGQLLADGSLAHLGRDDFQIKIRGHRVEVGEVESALLDHPDVREAAVVGRRTGDGGMRLLGYVVADAAVSSRPLRAFLRERLPDYMVPAILTVLEALPLLPNGKVDRQALPDPPPPAPSPPLGPGVEGVVAEVFAAVFVDELAGRPVGVRDDFLALGGDSLRAGQIVSRLRERVGVELPLGVVFESPTVGELAASVLALMMTSADPDA